MTDNALFQINESRPYRENGERKIFIQTILAEFVSDDEYRVLEVVAEEGRPPFDQTSQPVGGSFLPSVPARRFATGEWQAV